MAPAAPIPVRVAVPVPVRVAVPVPVPVTMAIPVLVLIVAVAAACSVDRAPETASVPATVIEDYPDAQTRWLAARARERRPVENSALPPRHLDPARHPESLVDRNRIVSGGPPPDGIASIDDPAFAPVGSIDWLADEEPVAVLTVAGVTRIYPIQILIWHEIVNDVITGTADRDRPITVTYCPLCNSVVAVDATITGPDGAPLGLDFGTSGALYQSALVMYDRQTESLWTHFDGRAVIGTLMGAQLPILAAAMVSWADASQAHPEAEVLQRPVGTTRPYGTVPYPNYETAPPGSGFVTLPPDDRLAPKDRVVGIDLGDRQIAIKRSTLAEAGVMTVPVADGPDLVALWVPGTASALDGRNIEDGVAVGSVGVFLADPGQPVTAGTLAGQTLEPVPHLDTFWFAWSGYHRETDLVE